MMHNSLPLALAAFTSITSVASVSCQCPRSIGEIIALEPQLNITRSLLASPCGQSLNSTLAKISQNMTVFAPTDSAWNSTFNLQSFPGFTNSSCSSSNSTVNANDCYRLLSGNLSASNPQDFLDCVPWVFLYHFAPGSYELMTSSNSTFASSNASASSIMVVSTALNHTLDGQDGVQVIVANSTNSTYVLQSAANYTANVISANKAKNGYLYMIDKVLIPPLPLNYTLEAFNATGFLPPGNSTLPGLNATNSSLTAFVPQASNFTEGFSYSSYIVPEALYLNETKSETLNLTSIGGDQLTFAIDASNRRASINGTLFVTRANIPLAQGVLHFVSPAATNTTNSTVSTTGTATPRNQNFWVGWLHGH